MGKVTSKPPVKIVQDENAVVAVEIIAKSLVDISDGMKHLLASGLNQRALLVLLKDSSGVSMQKIDKVLDAMASLKETYVK